MGRANTGRRANRTWIVLTTAVVVTLTAGSVAFGATVSPPPASIPPTDTDFALTVDVAQFDPTLGTLTAVTIELSAGVHGEMMVENLSTSSAGTGDISLEASVDLALQTDASVAVGPTIPSASQPFSLTACDTPDPTTFTGCDETPDFAGTAGVTVTGITSTDSLSGTFTDPAQLALFTGAGTVTFDVTAASQSTGSQDTGNVFFQFLTQASADVTVTYEYQEPGAPAIDIEKATNGEDADAPPGPQVLVGDPVTWTYVVTNTGAVDLTGVTVTDDQGVAVTCPQDTLAVGESMTCTGNGTAVLGQYANIGSVTGTGTDGTVVTDEDPSHYIAVGQTGGSPAIDIEKTPDLQALVIGADDTATWTITVTNTGDVDLMDVTVTDAQAPGCAAVIGDLAVGASTSYECSLSGITQPMTNVAEVTGHDAGGIVVTDEDDAQVVVSTPVTGPPPVRPLVILGMTMLLLGAVLVPERQRFTGNQR